MNFRQLVTRNVTRNGRAYGSYFLSSLFSVMVFFIFALLFFHPDFKRGLQGSSEYIGILSTVGMTVAQVVIVLMSFVFLWYAFSVFLKSRQHDFSIYLVLGMAKKDLKRMVFLENIILALSATVSGILLGTLFSKAFLLIAQNMLLLEEGMAFYLPIKPALLTFVVFAILFTVLAFLTTSRLATEDLAEMTKSGDKPLPEPKTHWFLSLLSLLLIATGYGSVFYFAYNIRSGSYSMTFNGLGWLLGGVLLTVAGSYLFFQQNIVAFFRLMKKSRGYFKEGQMLTISNLVYRMKNNGMMYFMISIVAAVAFVAIGVTMSLGGGEFARSQETNVAFIYNGFDKSPEGKKYHEKNKKFIEDEVKGAGYEALILHLEPLWFTMAGQEMGVSILPVSTYNDFAEFNGESPLYPQAQELIFFSETNTMVNKVKAEKLDKQVQDSELIFDDETTEGVHYRYTTARFSVGFSGLAVVADEFYETLRNRQDQSYQAFANEPYPYYETFVLHYAEWADDKALAEKISRTLKDEEEKNQEEWMAFNDELSDLSYEDYSPEQLAQEEKFSRVNFYFISLYSNWFEMKQTNGMILLISSLIGSVFFTFAACIIYFRLFGELNKDGAYHRSLHILGVSQKIRHKIVTKEMLLMYFVPIGLALLHFAMAMFAFSLLIEIPVWRYYAQISLVFLLFQLVFFFVSRWRYLHHLDFIAEQN